MAFTYFFRDLQTLDIIVEHLLPVLRANGALSIWDAGCAMGQEPYSLAMLLYDKLDFIEFCNVSILATDIDESNLFAKIISEANYHESLVQRIPEGFLSKYFYPNPCLESHFVLNDDVKSSVRYRRHNLLDGISPGKDFDLILCKNVLLHFNEQQRIEVIKMYHESLAVGGYLALEQTQKLPQEVKPLFEKTSSNVQLFRKICIKE